MPDIQRCSWWRAVFIWLDIRFIVFRTCNFHNFFFISILLSWALFPLSQTNNTLTFHGVTSTFNISKHVTIYVVKIGLRWQVLPFVNFQITHPNNPLKYNAVNHFGTFLLTHWGRDKMDAISQTTFSSAFCSMKMFEFWIKFHWSSFLRVQLTIFYHWFR